MTKLKKDQYSLATIFDQFQNLQKYLLLECLKVIISCRFSKKFMWIWSTHNLP